MLLLARPAPFKVVLGRLFPSADCRIRLVRLLALRFHKKQAKTQAGVDVHTSLRPGVYHETNSIHVGPKIKISGPTGGGYCSLCTFL